MVQLSILEGGVPGAPSTILPNRLRAGDRLNGQVTVSNVGAPGAMGLAISIDEIEFVRAFGEVGTGTVTFSLNEVAIPLTIPPGEYNWSIIVGEFGTRFDPVGNVQDSTTFPLEIDPAFGPTNGAADQGLSRGQLIAIGAGAAGILAAGAGLVASQGDGLGERVGEFRERVPAIR